MPLDIDRFAHIQSPLQQWDPRLKIASLGILIFGIALLKTLPLAVIALCLASVLLWSSALPYHFISHGIKWIIFFLLPFFLILPFSYPGEAAFHVLGLPFAWEGLRLATLIFIKALAIVMCTFTVFGTSRFDISMIALQHLKCPKIITQMLLFTYRYTFVFLEEMRSMQLAMQARGFVMKTNLYTLKVIGNFIGTLLIRSFERTERVYKAMLSKGYQGEFHSLVKFQAEPKDYIKAVAILSITIILVSSDFSGFFTPAIQGWF
ncbi:MAG TPA: cobalt ECF transporter T component CbiQ [Gammaproteobacteria bacterium]|nr:cobalt ECF transporter T component CbiQ [Gammaproteobacteria bacterium]